mmetsp:Transcript_6635/g.9565  ORF Transcript_6635/g.9565 Transcript_6635/m.9565 type:complete len:130 (-) Transcript_6635:369-758(-)
MRPTMIRQNAFGVHRSKFIIADIMTGSRLLLCHSSIGRAKKHSSARWIKRHESDPYVKRARKEGSPSRAMYKLEEIERMIKDKAKKFGARAANRKRGTSYKTILQNKTSLWNLFQPGNTVIDLGVNNSP